MLPSPAVSRLKKMKTCQSAYIKSRGNHTNVKNHDLETLHFSSSVYEVSLMCLIFFSIAANHSYNFQFRIILLTFSFLKCLIDKNYPVRNAELQQSDKIKNNLFLEKAWQNCLLHCKNPLKFVLDPSPDYEAMPFFEIKKDNRKTDDEYTIRFSKLFLTVPFSCQNRDDGMRRGRAQNFCQIKMQMDAQLGWWMIWRDKAKKKRIILNHFILVNSLNYLFIVLITQLDYTVLVAGTSKHA